MDLNDNIFGCGSNHEDFENKFHYIFNLIGKEYSINTLQELGLLWGLANLSQHDLEKLGKIHRDFGLVINLDNILPISSVNLNEDEIKILKYLQKRGIEVKTRESLLNMLLMYNHHRGNITGNFNCDILLIGNQNREKQLKRFLSKLFLEYKICNLQSFSIGVDGSNWILSVEISETSISISLGSDKIKRTLSKRNGKWKNNFKCLFNSNYKTKDDDKNKINEIIIKDLVGNNFSKALDSFFELCLKNKYSVSLFDVVDNKFIHYKNFDDLLDKVKNICRENSYESQIYFDENSISLMNNNYSIYAYRKGGGFSIKKIYNIEDIDDEWVSLEEFLREIDKLKLNG